MYRFSKIFSATMIVIASLLGASCKDTSNADSQAAARVGSYEITLEQVDRTIKQQLNASGGKGTLTPAELVAARLSVLDSMIQEETLYQKAQRENLVPDENKVTQEIQKTKQGLTEEQYQTQLKEAGLTEEYLRERARRLLAINELQEREKARVTAPTDAEIEKYYNDNKDRMVQSRGVDLSIVVADPANNGYADDAIGDQAAETKIKAIYEQLRSGTDFATIARQRSEHESAANGGNLGFGDEAGLRQLFPTRPEIAQRLLTQMNPGQYTEPVKDNLGGQWVIFKLNGKRDKPVNLTIDDVRKNIIDAITQQRQQILWQSLLLVARSEVSTKNYLAESIVQNPKSIADMQPSKLLQQSAAKPQPQPSPQPRIENENQNSSQAPTSNANR